MKTKFLGTAVLVVLGASVFCNTTRAATPANRLAVLSAKTSALPATTVAEQTWQVVLAVALERAKACLEAKLPSDAEMLLSDMEAALPRDAARFATPNQSAENIGVLASLFVTNGNPYLDQMVSGARAVLASEDQPWLKSLPEKCVFDGIHGRYGARDVAWTMETLWWLYAHPASPLHGDREVLARLLRRFHAYVDAINTLGPSTRHGALFFDDFAISPASCVLRELPALLPGLLLPGQKKDLDHAMRFAGDKVLAAAKDRSGEYANIDVAIAHELLNFGLHLRDQAMLDKASFLIHAQEKNLLGDGGFHYIWSQNESAGYHGTVTDYLTRYLEITGDPKVADLLRRSQWHGPVVGRLIDFWTCPSWKQAWNQSSGPVFGGESVVALSGNPFVRGLQNSASLRSHRTEAFRQVRWFRNDVPARPLPDHYTAPDRDIAGVRAWYGPFNYAITLRPVADTEPGLATIMGAQLATPDARLQQSLMGVHARARIRPEGFKDQELRKDSWAWITSGLQGACLTGRHFSAAAASYQVHAFGSSRKGPLADWIGIQVWIGLPDRIIGLVSLRPKSEGAKAYEINGTIQFGFGGTATGTPAKLTADETNRFRYGGFDVVVHESTYARSVTQTIPFRIPNAPISEVLFRDDAGLTNTANKPLSYALTNDFTFVAEIRPHSSEPPAKVTRRAQPDGTVTLEVGAGSKSYLALFNPTGRSANCALPSPATSSLRVSGQDAPPPSRSVAASLTLAPSQLALLVTSPDTVDHLPGWTSFSEMVGAPASGFFSLPKTN